MSNRFNVLSDQDLESKDAFENIEDTGSVDLDRIVHNVAFIGSNVQDRPVVIAINKSKDRFTAFLDTGSPASIMDVHSYKTLFSEFPLNKSNANLRGLGRGGLEAIGEVSPTFWIANEKIKDPFVVITNVQMHPVLILGHGLMRRHRICWDPESETALVKGKRVRKGFVSDKREGYSSDQFEVGCRREE